MAYIKTIWENLPSENTPINASNLNKMENGIYNNSIKADQVGDLTQLQTTEKSNLVGAINENNSQITNLNTYSTTEQIIGTWIDNKPIYRKCFYINSLPNASTLITDYSIDNLGWVIDVYGTARNRTNYQNMFPINNSRPISTNSTVGAYYDQSIKIETNTDRSGFEAYIIVEYTKTTD